MSLSFTFNGHTYNTDDYDSGSNPFGVGGGGARLLWNQMWSDIMTDIASALQMTATDSISIGTGSKVFTPTTLRGVPVGSPITVIHDTNNKMYGFVTAVGSGQVTVSVYRTIGSGGPYTSWTLQPSGPPGATITAAAGVPSDANGIDGDVYINASTADLYQKAGGTWGAALVNLRGPADFNAKTYTTGDVTAVDRSDILCKGSTTQNVTLPATPTTGMKVRVWHKNSAADVNVLRNGSTIDGAASDWAIEFAGSAGRGFIFEYDGATWQVYFIGGIATS